MSDDPARNGTSIGEGGRRLRPTVIGSATGGKAGPGREKERPSGTDASPRPNAPDGQARLRPTAKASSPAPFRTVTAPTAIPGVERKRIAVTAADLERLSPGLSHPVAAKAIRLVEGFVEGQSDRQVTLWGHDAQRNYADIVSRTLALSQAEVLSRARGYVRRVIDLLGAIDLEAICGVRHPSGVFGRLFGGAGDRIDSPREFEAARVELDQLIALTGAAIEPLLELKEALEDQARLIRAVTTEIEAAALAAAFLSEHLTPDQPALSRRFLERSMSLTQTVLQIRGSASLHDSQGEQPLSLISAIQDVVMVAMPGWLGTMAALTTASSARRQPNPTEVGEHQQQLRTILQQLKA